MTDAEFLIPWILIPQLAHMWTCWKSSPSGWCNDVCSCLVLGQVWEDQNRMINRYSAAVEVWITWSGLGVCRAAVPQWLTHDLREGKKLQTFWMKSLETMRFHTERSEFLPQQNSVITVVLDTIINVNLRKSPVQMFSCTFVNLCCGESLFPRLGFISLLAVFLKVLVTLIISTLYDCVLHIIHSLNRLKSQPFFIESFFDQKFLIFKTFHNPRSMRTLDAIVLQRSPSSQSCRQLA